MLKKIISLLTLLFILLFFYFVISQYLSEKNIKIIKKNRANINKDIIHKISDLPFLENDTNNVIEFNSGFNSEDKNKRKFWDLIKRNNK